VQRIERAQLDEVAMGIMAAIIYAAQGSPPDAPECVDRARELYALVIGTRKVSHARN
jgi:hypothetical protein